MKTLLIVLILFMQLLITSLADSKYPEWTYLQQKGQSSYCLTITDSIDSARRAAILFAGLELPSNVSKSIVSGRESFNLREASGNDADITYQQTIEIANFGDEPVVTLVKEQIIENEICVLVK